MSGQADPRRPTPTLASSTPALPATSLSEQTKAERMLRSSARCRQSKSRQTALAPSARRPTEPMISAAGTSPRSSFVATSTSTPTPNVAMSRPLPSATRACQRAPRPSA